MKNAVIQLLITVAALLGMSQSVATAFTPEPPPDEELVRRVEERVELLRKWRVIEAIDPSPELADELFPLLSHHERTDRELDHERERLTRELRRVLNEEQAHREPLHGILSSLARIRDQRCLLQKELDEELALLLTIEQRARLMVVLDDFHREVQQLIQRARRRPEVLRRDQPGVPGP
jgi:hypothetical protein